jgi:hypothetical protein
LFKDKDEEASLGSPRLTASRTAWPTNERVQNLMVSSKCIEVCIINSFSFQSFGDGLNDDDKVSKVATLVPKGASFYKILVLQSKRAFQLRLNRNTT